MGKSWQEIVYIILAVLWIAQGGYEIAQAFRVVPTVFFSYGSEKMIGIVGVVEIALGAGLLLEQIWAQFLVKIFSILTIIWCIFAFLIIMMIPNSTLMLLAIIGNSYNLAKAGMQLYVINVVGDV